MHLRRPPRDGGPAVDGGDGVAPASRAQLWPWAAAGALAGVLQFLVVHHSLVDDAYITMTYARNLAFHGTWGLLSDVRSNTATSPLFVLVLAVPTLVLRSPVAALAAFTVLAFALLGLCVAGAARATGAPRLVTSLALVLVLVNPLLLSSAGLETLLLVTLLAALVWSGTAGRPVVFGLLAGALVLTRIDAGVFDAVLALGLPAVRRRLHVAVLAALVVVLPWYAYSWTVLGSAIPDTLLLKQDETWGPWTFASGPHLYYLTYPVATLLSFAAPVVGVLLALALLVLSLRRRVPWSASAPWLLVALGGVLVYAAYSSLIVPPYHWYYGSCVGALNLAAAGCAGVLVARARRTEAAGAGAVEATPAASATATGVRVPAWAGPAAAGGVVTLVLLAAVFDGARGPAWHQAAISTNWALPAQYLAIGADVERDIPRGARVHSPGEIGTLQLQCDCVVDQFSDPAVLRPVIDRRITESRGIGRRLLELNYRNLPAKGRGVPTAFRITYLPGHPARAPGDLATWPVRSSWRGSGTLTLQAGSDAS